MHLTKRHLLHAVIALFLCLGIGQSVFGDLSDSDIGRRTWSWVNPWPQGNTLFGVGGTSSSSLFLVGEKGTILQYADGEWNSWNSRVSNTLSAVWEVRPDSVYAVGEQGLVLHYDGETWSRMTTVAFNFDLTGVWGSSDENLFVVGRSRSQDSLEGVILRYDGSNWLKMATGLKDFELRAIWGTGPSDVWAVGLQYGNQALHGVILHYDGREWSVSSTGTYSPLFDVRGDENGNGYAVGSDGTVLNYDGAAWSFVKYDPSLSDITWSEFRKVSVGPDGSLAVLDVWQNRVLSFHEGTWSWIDIPPDFTPNAIHGTPASGLLTVGSQGHMYRYDQGSWSPLTNVITTSDLNAIRGSSPENVFAVGKGGVILHYDGGAWAPMQSGVNLELRGVWASPWEYALAVGAEGTILINQDNGWAPMESGVTSDLNAVYGPPITDYYAIYAVGKNGVVLYYDGFEWYHPDMGIDVDLNDVWVSERGQVFVVGQGGLILQFDGRSWEQVPSGTSEDLNAITGIRVSALSQYVVAVGDSGTILVFDGKTWSPFPSNLSIDLIGVGVTGLRSLFVLGRDGSGHLHDGALWQPSILPASVAVRSVWADSRQDLFAVGDSGTILRYAEQNLPSPGVTLLSDRSFYLSSDTIHITAWVENKGPSIQVAFYLYLFTPPPLSEVYYLTGSGWHPASAPMLASVNIPAGFTFAGELLTILPSTSEPPFDAPGMYRIEAGFFDVDVHNSVGNLSTLEFYIE
ncbi:MAG: hypothetical protein HY788_18360 [Deltaproteobacteria bacterium]|nr:hypothetical protein [Deltaproteobacteria bacterium]